MCSLEGCIAESQMLCADSFQIIMEKLEALKIAVIERRCKGPLEVMEVLVEKIRRRGREDGWEVPLTLSLPRGKK